MCEKRISLTEIVSSDSAQLAKSANLHGMQFAFLLMWKRSAGTVAEHRLGLRRSGRTQGPAEHFARSGEGIGHPPHAGQTILIHQNLNRGVGSEGSHLWITGT